jgi:CTP:molybdopterin cytidylyltransferase MocA
VLAGLILAGGDGSRFGPESKLVQPLAGRALLEHAVRAMCTVPAIDRVVVVLGANADLVRARVDFDRAETFVCRTWPLGMSETLKHGLAVLGPTEERVVVTLGDSPTVTPAVIERIAAAAPGARAVYQGVPGHPVLLGAAEIAAVQAVGGDQGARGLLGGPTLECADLCSGLDVDTPADLALLRRTWRPGPGQVSADESGRRR